MLHGDHLIAILWKRKITFVLVFALVLGAAAAVTFSLPKVYETRAYLYVSSGGGSVSDFEQVQTNQVVVKTLAELLQSRNVAEASASRLPFPESGQGLLGSVQIEAIPQSQLITIGASAAQPARAQTIANTYAGTFVLLQRELLSLDAATRQASLAASAPLVTAPSRPKPILYLLVGALVAVFVATGAAVLRQRTDRRLRLDPSTTEIEGVSIIGRIPRVPQSAVGTHLMDEHRPESARRLDEAFRFVLANLAFVNGGRRPRTLAVVSAGQSEGKSTTCLSLAIAAAELGIRALLVDGDMRRPRLAGLIGQPTNGPQPGFSSILGNISDEHLLKGVQEVGGSGLLVLPAGPQPPNPAALLGSARLDEFTRDVQKGFELVIFDTPPLTVGADASLVAAVSEGVILVIDARTTSRPDLLRALDQLRRTNANVLGVVLNRVTERSDHGYYYAVDSGRRGWRPSRRAGKQTESVPVGVSEEQ
jgi:capsular exopolysaccharide synthesis family protein